MMLSELYTIPLFDDATDDELEWLIANSYEAELNRGDYFFRENERSNKFYIVLEGELQVTRTMGGQETIMGTTPRGIIGGELALLYGATSPVTARAITPSRLLVFDLPAFRAMFGACPTVGARILRIAAERTSGVASMVKQKEKMAALGKLSAGLAHELNNPAAAAQRASKTLREALVDLQTQTMKLCGAGLSQAQLDNLQTFQQQVLARTAYTPPLSPLEQSDREEELSDWLVQQSVTNPWEVAASLVSVRVTLAELTELTATFPPDSANVTLVWLCQSLTATRMLEEIEQSMTRISELVGAIKQYTYMDQAPLQEVDLHKGLENTLKVLNYKLKQVNVIREYDPDMPSILARGGDLNQVWTNLIDNAIDALDGSGRGTIWIITRYENNFAMVEIADNGPGIPSEIQPHLFEPFFTTKEVGAGTGLGLDITYRIIQQHNGTIEVQSQPGHTRFIVRLPIGMNRDKEFKDEQLPTP
jgi:signal transduction histidine kinase